MKITAEPFGTAADGVPVTRYWLKDGDFRAAVLTWGGVLQSLLVPDRNGIPVDVVLGFENMKAYEKQNCFIGAVIGRCANRIGGGNFVLNGERLSFPLNDGGVHHLHGGPMGFDRKHWEARVLPDALELSLTSPVGENGYPGNLRVKVTYRLERGVLILTYDGASDADTLCSLTSHSYFNLAGEGDVGDQTIQVEAPAYASHGSDHVPDGTLPSVEDTPMDLRKAVRLGGFWNNKFEQIRWYGGIDHYYPVEGNGMRFFGEACCVETGIRMSVSSDCPGVQVYTGNTLSAENGKRGGRYGAHQGFCLETQGPPNPPVWPEEMWPVLRKGQHYHTETRFAFSNLTNLY